MADEAAGDWWLSITARLSVSGCRDRRRTRGWSPPVRHPTRRRCPGGRGLVLVAVERDAAVARHLGRDGGQATGEDARPRGGAVRRRRRLGWLGGDEARRTLEEQRDAILRLAEDGDRQPTLDGEANQLHPARGFPRCRAVPCANWSYRDHLGEPEVRLQVPVPASVVEEHPAAFKLPDGGAHGSERRLEELPVVDEQDCPPRRYRGRAGCGTAPPDRVRAQASGAATGRARPGGRQVHLHVPRPPPPSGRAHGDHGRVRLR